MPRAYIRGTYIWELISGGGTFIQGLKYPEGLYPGGLTTDGLISRGAFYLRLEIGFICGLLSRELEVHTDNF